MGCRLSPARSDSMLIATRAIFSKRESYKALPIPCWRMSAHEKNEGFPTVMRQRYRSNFLQLRGASAVVLIDENGVL